MRATLLVRPGAAFDQQRLNAVHGAAKVLIGSRPARGMDAGLPAKRIDHQTGVISERGLSARAGRGLRLDARIRRESLASLFWLRQTEVASRLYNDAERRQQLAHFLQFAWIVSGDHHWPGECSAHITAIFCKPTSFSMPLRASASSAAN